MQSGISVMQVKLQKFRIISYLIRTNYITILNAILQIIFNDITKWNTLLKVFILLIKAYFLNITLLIKSLDRLVYLLMHF